jgi:hypothetical protein
MRNLGARKNGRYEAGAAAVVPDVVHLRQGASREADSQNRTATPVPRAEPKAMLETAEMMARTTAGWVPHVSTMRPLEAQTTTAAAAAHAFMAPRDIMPVHGLPAKDKLVKRNKLL